MTDRQFDDNAAQSHAHSQLVTVVQDYAPDCGAINSRYTLVY